MNENIKEKIRILSSVLDVDQNQLIDFTACSLRSKDPEWFQGIILIFLVVFLLNNNIDFLFI